MVSLRSSCSAGRPLPRRRSSPPPLPEGAALELISKTSKGISNSGEEEEEASSLPLGGAREGGGGRVVEEVAPVGTESIERFDWTTRGTNMPLESEFVKW